jgi:hypothetical protein
MSDKITLELTPEEAAAVHAALLSCFYLARDEEKTLAQIKAESEGDDAKVADHGRAAAALRAFRYAALAERVDRATRTVRTTP